MENETQKEEKLQSITPPEEVFEQQAVSIHERVGSKGYKLHIFTHIDVPESGGMYLHFKGVKYPKKGFPYPEAIDRANMVKRQLMMMINTVARKEMVFAAAGVAILSHKKKIAILENALSQFIRGNDYLLTNIYLKEKYMTPCAREILKFISLFLYDVGISFNIAKGAAKILAHLIELDDAYRYRVQDLMTETNKAEFMEYPRGEIEKLINLFAQRDKNGNAVIDKFKAVGRLLSFVLLSRKIRKSFTTAFASIDIKNMQMDEADQYHCLLRDDYDFGGKTYEYRSSIYEEVHKGEYPPMIEML